MEIIAKTENGYIVSATEQEIVSIFNATGRKITKKDEYPKLGEKIPAFDYASIIENCKSFSKSTDFTCFKRYVNDLQDSSGKLIKSIEDLVFDK